MPFSFAIHAADATLFEGEVESVSVPTTSGIITVLSGHTPLMSTVAPGALVIHMKSGEKNIAVGAGTVECSGSGVTLLADRATRSEDIDEKAAKEAAERAEKTLQQAATQPEIIAAKAALAHAIAELRVAQRRRKK